jgi:hypothetical protein
LCIRDRIWCGRRGVGTVVGMGPVGEGMGELGAGRGGVGIVGMIIMRVMHWRGNVIYVYLL